MSFLVYTTKYSDGEDIFYRFPFSGQMKTAVREIMEKGDAELTRLAIEYFDGIIQSAPYIAGAASLQALSDNDIDDGADTIVAFCKFFEARGYNTSTWVKD